jgi:lysophospholipase L1-like esterase
MTSKRHKTHWRNTFNGTRAFEIDILVIFLGSNDAQTAQTPTYLEHIRASTRAHRVIWVIPVVATHRADVLKVASRHGDLVIDAANAQLSGHGIHPSQTGYEPLSKGILSRHGQ